ncbi:hypothetical protein MACH15_01710 [Maricaulis maris]|nr:hypothetical protein MACH15_01710 [Maricaulis maris]
MRFNKRPHARDQVCNGVPLRRDTIGMAIKRKLRALTQHHKPGLESVKVSFANHPIFAVR